MAAATLETPAAKTFDPTNAPAPIALTARAAQEVRDILEQQPDIEGVHLRVYVAGGGCSGLQYGMALDENIEEGDKVFPAYVQFTHEVTNEVYHSVDESFSVIIDEQTFPYIVGSIVDYVTTPMGGGFKVENPNAVRSCGCGSSFSTEDDAEGKTITGGCGSCRA